MLCTDVSVALKSKNIFLLWKMKEVEKRLKRREVLFVTKTENIGPHKKM